MLTICFFDDQSTAFFQPLTLTRPMGDLRIGILTIAEKWMHEVSLHSVRYLSQPHLRKVFSSNLPKNSSEELWINSRYLPVDDLVEQIKSLDANFGLKNGDDIIAAQLDRSVSKKITDPEELKNLDIQYKQAETSPALQRLWDLFLQNGDQIKQDIQRLSKISSFTKSFSSNIQLINAADIFIAESASIEPGVILIAKDGPVYIGENATIQAGSILRGPVAICEDATLKMGSKIYENTTIGPVCKVGGEVTNCIFHSYSNKGHEGFTGNSLFGQWCNLGADTNTSNLKNNYSTIRLTDFKTGKQEETNQQFIGTIMGDHSKTSINTMLNTGTVCGVSSNIFSSVFPPKFIPSFRWLGSSMEIHRFDKAIETMERMMQRRNCTLTDDYKAMMKHIYNQTEPE